MGNTAATMTATTSLADYEGVQKAMQGYIDGVMEGRSDRMKPSFHPAASFFGHYTGTEFSRAALGAPPARG